MEQNVLRYAPAVFAVEDTYQIMVAVTVPTLMWVRVGEKCYYDHCNGILRSDVTVHRMTVPAKVLEAAGGYTVCYRVIEKRKAYFSRTGEVEEIAFSFRPVPPENARIYHIADAHNMTAQPKAAADTYEKLRGRIDLLILNGDVPNHSDTVANFDNIYKIVSDITGGELPTLFSRGNHDTRGICAEKLADYTPCHGGNSYFTFRVGSIWGVVLDCGEDKVDEHPEYGNTVCCHAFREEETAFLRRVVAQKAYNAPDITHRLVVMHVPLVCNFRELFCIEDEIYGEWTRLIDEIAPHLMITGHSHCLALLLPHHEGHRFDHGYPVLIGSKPVMKEEDRYFAGSGLELTPTHIDILFTDSNGEEKGAHRIDL